MLVLKRKVNKSIIIDHDIEIMVLEIRDGVVKLGITAPSDTQVDRLEIYNAKREGENAND